VCFVNVMILCRRYHCTVCFVGVMNNNMFKGVLIACVLLVLLFMCLKGVMMVCIFLVLRFCI
jgi:hypothetical protein